MGRTYEGLKPTKMQVIAPIIVLVVTLVAGGIMIGVAKMLGSESEKTNYLAPSKQTVQLEAGSYTIYLLTEVDFEGKHYSLPEEFSELSVTVKHNGSSITVTEPECPYSFGDDNTYKGTTLNSFIVEEAGSYEIETQINSSAVSEAVYALGVTERKLQVVVTLTFVAAMIILMGVLQFFGYLILNGGRMLYYQYKVKNDTTIRSK